MATLPSSYQKPTLLKTLRLWKSHFPKFYYKINFQVLAAPTLPRAGCSHKDSCLHYSCDSHLIPRLFLLSSAQNPNLISHSLVCKEAGPRPRPMPSTPCLFQNTVSPRAHAPAALCLLASSWPFFCLFRRTEPWRTQLQLHQQLHSSG